MDLHLIYHQVNDVQTSQKVNTLTMLQLNCKLKIKPFQMLLQLRNHYKMYKVIVLLQMQHIYNRINPLLNIFDN